MPTLSLTIPTYNERKNLPLIVEKVDKILTSSDLDYEILVVDDSSPDGTWEVALALGKDYPVRLIRREEKNGLSSAILTGFRNSKGRFIGVIDADLQHPPEVIPRLITKVQNGSDIAIASRWVDGGKVTGWSKPRYLVSKGAEFLAKILVSSSRGIKDPLSGCFVMKREALNGIRKPIGYKILLDVLVHANGSRVCEVPYTFHERRNGDSKLSLNEYMTYLRHLVRLWREERTLKEDIGS
jgi:dolichol-phosphate mannosyltransferase